MTKHWPPASALRLRPDHPEALNNLGTSLEALGRLTEAGRFIA
jgi:Flp pilus assembly protein TadD